MFSIWVLQVKLGLHLQKVWLVLHLGCISTLHWWNIPSRIYVCIIRFRPVIVQLGINLWVKDTFIHWIHQLIRNEAHFNITYPAFFSCTTIISHFMHFLFLTFSSFFFISIQATIHWRFFFLFTEKKNCFIFTLEVSSKEWLWKHILNSWVIRNLSWFSFYFLLNLT